jgi:hypothetical protein
VVQAIQALRGIELTGAVILIAELGDLTRFDSPRKLMAYLELTPSEYSSGDYRRQGGITKAGNSHARRALVEGAWAYRFPAKVSRHLQLRLEQVPAEIQAISWKAQVRLCKRYRQLSARGKHVNPGRGRGGPRDGGLRLGHCPPRARGVVTLDREPTAFQGRSQAMTHRAQAQEGPSVHRGAISISPHATRQPGPRPREHSSIDPLITISSHRRRRSPGIGAIFDRVTRLRPSPLERSRRCDGHQYGGTQPTDISMIDRREYRLRLHRWLEFP